MQIPVYWDPHMRLEYMKVAVRTVLSRQIGLNKKELKNEITDIEDSINEMHNLKISSLNTIDCPERSHKIDLINNAISRLEKDLSILREKQSAENTFRANANWYEQGEKSKKYFLNLNKRYKKQKLISEIICSDK